MKKIEAEMLRILTERTGSLGAARAMMETLTPEEAKALKAEAAK